MRGNARFCAASERAQVGFKASPNLGIVDMVAAQAAKEVTHNTSVALLFGAP